MLQVQVIREQKQAVINGLQKRGLKEVETALDTIINLDNKRKETQGRREEV